jgi:cell wall-associated NlpC family hydrolase
MTRVMARRALTLCAFACALVLAAPAAAAGSWALPQIKVVTAHGLMGGKAAGFRPDDPLSAGELADLVAGLTGKEAPMAVDPAAPVTIAQLDAQLVKALGLVPAAQRLTAAVRAAGIVPPRNFGTEAAARLIGLRVDHPTAQDTLEVGPNDVASRAEAAYSAARILGFTGGEADWAAKAVGTFQLPELTENQRAILQVALSFVGYPYIWGGTSERPQDPFSTGKTVPGGFDCSGLAWRVYKLQAYTGGATLGTTLKGRTTYAMSGEVPAAKRIPFAKLQPGDLMFFGSNGPKSKPGVVDHTALYLGNGWFIQSSGEGVTLLPFDGWYTRTFAWARRPLREAGLSG